MMKLLSSLLLLVFLSAPVMALDTTGVWQQGAVITGRVEVGTQVRFMDRDVRVTPSGQFVIGLGRDAKAQAVLTTVDASGVETPHLFDVGKRKYNIQKIEGVPKKTVNPSKEQVARSRKEGAQAWRARQIDSPREDFALSLIHI